MSMERKEKKSRRLDSIPDTIWLWQQKTKTHSGQTWFANKLETQETEQPGLNISRKTVSFGRARYCRLRALLSKSSITRAQVTWEAECTVAGTLGRRKNHTVWTRFHGCCRGIEDSEDTMEAKGRFGNYVYIKPGLYFRLFTHSTLFLAGSWEGEKPQPWRRKNWANFWVCCWRATVPYFKEFSLKGPYYQEGYQKWNENRPVVQASFHENHGKSFTWFTLIFKLIFDSQAAFFLGEVSFKCEK